MMPHDVLLIATAVVVIAAIVFAWYRYSLRAAYPDLVLITATERIELPNVATSEDCPSLLPETQVQEIWLPNAVRWFPPTVQVYHNSRGGLAEIPCFNAQFPRNEGKTFRVKPSLRLATGDILIIKVNTLFGSFPRQLFCKST